MAGHTDSGAREWLLGADAAENGARGGTGSSGLGACDSNLDGGTAAPAPSAAQLLDVRCVAWLACLLWTLHQHAFVCAQGAHRACRMLSGRWNGAGCCASSGAGLRRRCSVAAGLGTTAEQAVGDAYKEARRRDVRTVFNHLRWKQHRSSCRYWRHLLGSWGGRSVADVEGETVAAFDLPSKARAGFALLLCSSFDTVTLQLAPALLHC